MITGNGKAVMGGVLGAAGGLYLGHKLGQLGHGYGHSYGHDYNYGQHERMRDRFGYYENENYVRCDPPIITEINGTLFIP